MCQNEQLGCLVDPATGLTVRYFDQQKENQIKSFFLIFKHSPENNFSLMYMQPGMELTVS